MRCLQSFAFGAILLGCAAHCNADEPRPSEDASIEVDGNTLAFRRFEAIGEHLLLWISPGYGEPDRSMQLAADIAKRGIEVWHIDIAESLFLPSGNNTLRELDGRYVASLISAAHEQTGKTVTLGTRAYGALPVLRGARIWQQHYADSQRAGRGAARTESTRPYFAGAILFSPELYSSVPELGVPPVYDPIARATNIPIMIYQSGKRGNRWQLDSHIEQLESGGAKLMLKVLPGVTGVFYSEDIAAETLDTLTKLPDEIPRVIHALLKMELPVSVASLEDSETIPANTLDVTLMPFRGKPEPAALDVMDSRGNQYRSGDYHGKVTLVNFWASWCQPCVEEIPSLNHLREKMQGRPFELVSVNYAEDKQRISEFLKMVKVDFPVLLDSDGRISANWGVLVFPATFVIGPDARIIYGVNGAIYWDNPEVVALIEKLMPTAH